MAVQGERVGLYLSGQPVLVPNCNIYITQPTIKEVTLFGEDNFLLVSRLLGHTEEVTKQMKEGNSQLETFSDFQLLLIIMREQDNIRKDIEKFFELIFPNYRIDFKDAEIDFYIIQENEEFVGGRLFPFNFSDFQQTINDLFEPKPINEGEIEYNPANDLAAEIAAKLKRGRDLKNQRRAEKEGPQSLFGRYASVLAVGMQMDISIFYNYTPFQLYDAYNRYFLKVGNDFYRKVISTPFMDASAMEEPRDWAENLYK